MAAESMKGLKGQDAMHYRPSMRWLSPCMYSYVPEAHPRLSFSSLLQLFASHLSLAARAQTERVAMWIWLSFSCTASGHTVSQQLETFSADVPFGK